MLHDVYDNARAVHEYPNPNIDLSRRPPGRRGPISSHDDSSSVHVSSPEPASAPSPASESLEAQGVRPKSRRGEPHPSHLFNPGWSFAL